LALKNKKTAMVQRLPGDQMHALMQNYVQGTARRRFRSNIDDTHDADDDDEDEDGMNSDDQDSDGGAKTNNNDDDDDVDMDGHNDGQVQDNEASHSTMFDLMASFVRNRSRENNNNNKSKPLFQKYKRKRSLGSGDDDDDDDQNDGDEKENSSSEAEETSVDDHSENSRQTKKRPQSTRQSSRTSKRKKRKRNVHTSDESEAEEASDDDDEESSEEKDGNQGENKKKKQEEDVDGIAGTGIACEQLVIDDTDDNRRQKRLRQEMETLAKSTTPLSHAKKNLPNNPVHYQQQQQQPHQTQYPLSGQAMTSRKFRILDAISRDKKKQDQRTSPSAPGLGLSASTSSSSSLSSQHGQQPPSSAQSHSPPLHPRPLLPQQQQQQQQPSQSPLPPASLQSHAFMCKCDLCVAKLPLDLQQTLRPDYRPSGNSYAQPVYQQQQRQQFHQSNAPGQGSLSFSTTPTEPFAVSLFDETWMGPVSARDLMPCQICFKIKQGQPNSDSSKEHKNEIELRELLAHVAYTPFEILCPVIQMFLRARYNKDMTLRGIYQHFLNHSRDEHVEQNFYGRANFEIGRILTDSGLCVYDPRSGKILANSIGIRNFLQIQRASQNLNDSKRAAGHRRG
jgi:hypothetical protein